MRKIRLKTFFYFLFLIFLLVIIGGGGIVINSTISVAKYRKTYTSINENHNVWRDMLVSEKNFLIDYNNDIVFFQTEQNKYAKKSQLDFINLNNLLDSIIKNSNNISVDYINLLSEIKVDLQTTEQIFEKLSNNLFLRGSNSTGTIGDCFSFYNLSLTYSNDEKQRIYLNGMYDKFLEYLHQPDSKTYQEFMNIFLQLNSYISSQIVNADTTKLDTTTFIQANNNISEDFINNVNAFKRSYTKLVELDNIIFMNPNNNLYLQLNESIKKTDLDWVNLNKGLRDTFYHKISKTQILLYSSLFLILLFLTVILIYFPNNFIKQLTGIKNHFNNFTVGDFQVVDEKTHIIEEFHETIKDVNTIAASMKKASQFAYEMGKSNFNFDYAPLSNKDVLGNALIVLRDNLIKSKKEEEQRREEDNIRQWVNEGIAKFSDILRQSTDDISELATKVIKELVSYVEANQGGVFVINNNNKDKVVLELVASYAYNKERKKRKVFLLGEGLVGTCALEKATMYMTDIPEDYISISSGLGSSNPRSLIIVPLLFEENVLGVIEMASFEELPKHKIEFVEKIAESIASTISIAIINERTTKLLEMSKKEAEQRALKEEELRQNLEELKATQDRAAFHERELNNLFDLINKVAFVIELDLDGNISSVPDRLSGFFELQQSEIVGRHLSEFDFNNNSEFVKPEFWQDLLEGKEKEYILKYVGLDKTSWMKVYIIPSYNISGNIEKFIGVFFDITDQIELQQEMSKQTEELKEKEKEIIEKVKELEKLKVKADHLLLELQGTMQGVDRTVLRAEYLPDGTFVDANEYHQKVLGYRKASMINKSILEFIAPEERDNFMKFWKEVAKGKPATLTVKRENKDTGIDIWLINYYNPIIGSDNKVEKILYLAIDITEQKETEEKLKLKNEEFTAAEKELKEYNEELISFTENLKTQKETIEKQNKELTTITDNTYDAIILINNSEEIAFWNKAAEKIFGYTKNEIIGKNLHEILAPPEYRPIAHKAFAQFKNTGKGKALNKTLELTALRKNGEIFPIELSLSPLKLDDKWSAVGIVRDITEQKETEEKLKNLVETNQKNFSSIFNLLDNSSDALQILKDGKFINCNESTLKLFEFDNKEEFTKTSPADVSPEKQPDGRNSMEKAMEMIKKAMSEGYTSFDWVHKTKTGKDFNCTVNLALIKLPDADYIYAMVKPKK